MKASQRSAGRNNNPYGIDDRAWAKIVGRRKPTIDRVMFAAAIDPLLLVDLDMIQPPRSFAECVYLGEMGTRGDLRAYLKSVLIQWTYHSLELAALGHDRFKAARGNVRQTVRNIFNWDKRLGVWCVATCAESMLRFIPVGEDRPRLAVEAAKDWVFGVIDETATRAAADAAYLVHYAAAAYTTNAAFAAAAYTAFAAARAASNTSNAVVFAAAAAVAATDAYYAAYAANAADYAAYAAASNAVRDAIVRAIESYPMPQ